MPVKTAIIKESTNNKFWIGCGEKETLFTLLVGMKTGTASMENSMEIPF